MSVALSPSLPLLVHSLRWRRWIFLCFAVILATSLVLAMVVRPKYAATTSLLVLLGSEYTVRATAGEGVAATGTPDHEQILRGEAEILQSDALQRAVIRRIGLAKLYPDYLAAPGLMGQVLGAVKGVFQGQRAKPDPVDLAQIEFDRNFSATVLKQGDAIELRFTHRDPGLAAEVLNTLVKLYLRQRAQLYEDGQLKLVRAQAAHQQKVLRAAEESLAAFKAAHGIASFETRRDILLHQQGDAEREVNDAGSQYAQIAARLGRLRTQLAATPDFSPQSDDIETETRVSDLRTSLDGLHARLAQLRTSYRDDGLVVRSVRAQIEAREGELARQLRDRTPTTLHTAQNPIWATLQGDALHAASELDAARARRDQAVQALAGVQGELATLSGLDDQFQLLQRQRDIAEDDDKTAARLVADRQMVESVSAGKQASVRQIAPAAVPVKPGPMQLLIVLGGFVLALFSAAGLALGSNLLRRVYLLPAELEQDLGIAVLASVPELSPDQVGDLVLARVTG